MRYRLRPPDERVGVKAVVLGFDMGEHKAGDTVEYDIQTAEGLVFDGYARWPVVERVKRAFKK